MLATNFESSSIVICILSCIDCFENKEVFRDGCKRQGVHRQEYVRGKKQRQSNKSRLIENNHGSQVK